MYVYVSTCVSHVYGHIDKKQKEHKGWGGNNTKKLHCLGISVAIFLEECSYFYFLYWMISEQLKNNCFPTKDPIAGNAGIQIKMLSFLGLLNCENCGRFQKKFF